MQKKIITTVIFFTFLFSAKSQYVDITWQQCLTNVRNNSYSYDICNFNNGFLITANIEAYTSDSIRNIDIWLAYIDSIGNQIWEKTIGGSSMDATELLLPINDEFFYLIGNTTSSDGNMTCEVNDDDGDNWIAKLNGNGKIIWQTCYGCSGFDDPRAALVTPDDGLLLMTGITKGGGDVDEYYGTFDMWIIKLDSTGALEWQTTLGTPGIDNGLQLLYTSLNTYIALCAVGDNGGVSECTLMNDPSDGKDIWLVELDLNGNIISQECYGGSIHDLAYDIIETNVGYTILSKSSSNDHDVSGNHGKWDFWLLGINYQREILWQKCLGGSSYDSPRFLSLQEDSTYILIGDTYSNDGDVTGNHNHLSDIWVVNADSVGNIIWQQCIGGGKEWFFGGNTIAKKNDYTYTIMSITSGHSGGDVDCLNYPIGEYYPWVFQIKDCSHYQPITPQKPIGKNKLCVNTDSVTTYTTVATANAWYYEWELQPSQAGVLQHDSSTATIHWNSLYEGSAIIKTRCSNDCGTSPWSDMIIVDTYICLGNDEFQLGKIPAVTVYPNPVNSELTVSYNYPNNNNTVFVDVLNTIGKKVYSTKMLHNAQQTKINVANWAAGLYIVRVTVASKVVGWSKVVVE